MFIPDKESGDMLLKRLELYEKFYSQISDVQKKGLENNRVATQRNLKRSIDQLESYLKTSLDSDPLLLVNFAPTVDKKEISEWKEKAKKVVE